MDFVRHGIAEVKRLFQSSGCRQRKSRKLNFFNQPPEDKFGNPRYGVAHLSKNYHPIQKPSTYDDVVALTDE